MKKIIACILIITALLCLTSCANPDIDKRIVGTWKSGSIHNSSYVFRSNGTFERTTASNQHYEGTYTAINGKLRLDYGNNSKVLYYEINTDKTSAYYGDMKINYEYFEKQ